MAPPPDPPAATLKLFVAQQCPFCGAARTALGALASAHEGLQLQIVDVHRSPEQARAHEVGAVPTLLIDDRWRVIGAVQRDDVLQLVTHPTRLGLCLLQRLLDQGNADALVAAMCERRSVPITLVDLLIDPTFSTRLGAMTVVEKTAEHDRELAAHVIEPLWLHFDQVSDTVRGDILYLIGQVGDRSHLALLRTVLDGPFGDEVKEAAREATEELDPDAEEAPERLPARD